MLQEPRSRLGKYPYRPEESHVDVNSEGWTVSSASHAAYCERLANVLLLTVRISFDDVL